LFLSEPDRDPNRYREAIVNDHEPLQELMPQLVVAHSWDDECSGIGGRRSVLN
jgi:hypothetical protein